MDWSSAGKRGPPGVSGPSRQCWPPDSERSRAARDPDGPDDAVAGGYWLMTGDDPVLSQRIFGWLASRISGIGWSVYTNVSVIGLSDSV